MGFHLFWHSLTLFQFCFFLETTQFQTLSINLFKYWYNFSFASSETGWDLGPFAAVLQCLHLDTSLLQQPTTKKYYRTKNNCLNVQLGQILDPKDTKRLKKKKKKPTFWKAWNKNSMSEQKQSTAHAPAHNTTLLLLLPSRFSTVRLCATP